MRWGGALWLRLPLGIWEASAGLTGLGASRIPVDRDGVLRGELAVWSVDVKVAGGVCASATGRHQLCADLLTGAEWLFGSASGTGVFQTHSATQNQPLLAWEVRYEYGLGENPLAVLLATRVTLRPWQGGFGVRDADAGYRSPRWAASVELGLWWQAL